MAPSSAIWLALLGICRMQARARLAVGGLHTCARFDTGGVICWGLNHLGQLGYGDMNFHGDKPNEMGDNLPFVNLGIGSRAAELAAGVFHTCARPDTGGVKCWGLNDDGRLGYGDMNNRGDEPNEMGGNLPFVNLGSGRSAVELAAGDYHTCARFDTGGVKCWGLNDDGQLGYGVRNARGGGAIEMGDNLPFVNLGSGRSAVELAAGYAHTCARLNTSGVKCWGGNGLGQLGYGDTNNRGDEPNEMGDNLPFVNVGSGLAAVELAAGNFHTCARLDLGGVKCWGLNYNAWGEPNLRGNEPNEMGDNLPFVNLGSGLAVVGLTAGSYHNCAHFDTGGVKCWGQNHLGQLGYGDTNTRDGPNEMGDNLPFVNLGGWRAAVELAAGYDRTCARLNTGGVKCWGGNGLGQLGYGDMNNRGDEPNEMGNNLPFVAGAQWVATTTSVTTTTTSVTTTTTSVTTTTTSVTTTTTSVTTTTTSVTTTTTSVTATTTSVTGGRVRAAIANHAATAGLNAAAVAMTSLSFCLHWAGGKGDW